MKNFKTIGKTHIYHKTTILLLIFLLSTAMPCFVSAQCNSIDGLYWEQMSNAMREATILSEDVDIDVVNYYNGIFKYSDDQKSIRLLNALVSEFGNANVKALYFYVFNKICTTSDGASSEILGGYCQKIILNDPMYVLTFFRTNSSLMETYATLLGYELYFKEDGTSDIEYDFKTLKNIVRNKIGDNTNLKETFNSFSSEIEVAMKRMD